jgi:hypothetical protein
MNQSMERRPHIEDVILAIPTKYSVYIFCVRFLLLYGLRTVYRFIGTLKKWGESKGQVTSRGNILTMPAMIQTKAKLGKIGLLSAVYRFSRV